jgi:hypothetical protein
MTYKEIVLKLLKSRDGLVCVEDHLLNDFRGQGNPSKTFLDWCSEHQIACQRVEDVSPSKLHLKKTLYKLN